RRGRSAPGGALAHTTQSVPLCGRQGRRRARRARARGRARAGAAVLAGARGFAGGARGRIDDRVASRGVVADRRAGARGRSGGGACRSGFSDSLVLLRGLLESGRGECDAARAHLEAATATLRPDRGLGLYDTWVSDLAIWERRFADADAAMKVALDMARQREA